ncbi:MAG: aldehyde dehydrogenase family protein [Mycobacterium sp.]|nr:aldehyde dehydrogenase family protein [Mycobacterium sp.]
MTTTLNYGSTDVDAELNDSFDAALRAARTPRAEVWPHVIAGVERTEGEVFTREDPARPGRVVSQANSGSEQLVSEAVAAARSAAYGWRSLPYQRRVELVRQAKAVFTDNLVVLAATISAETGKPRVEALAEAAEAVDLIEHYCEQMETNDGFVTALRSTETDTSTDILRPYGVFGVLAPFNFPVALAVNMSAAALVTGNTVVLKPSDKTPASTALAAQFLSAALPAGTVNVVHGGPDVGQLIAASEIDGLAFTGSAQVGWQLIRQLSGGPYGKPVLAEMGGNNPAIVMATADLDDAVEGVVRSAFGFSGQKCSATRRVIVDASVYQQMMDRLSTRVGELVVGDPEDHDSFIGPVIDEQILERVRAAVTTARADGATVIGGPMEGRPGHWVAPTVITGLPIGHRLTRDELFAPVITVTPVDGLDAALAEANAVDYGLSAGIFTAVEDEQQRFLDEIEAGVVYVNRRAGATTGAWPGLQSFCGWKASGSSGKGGLGPWYLQGFLREQNRTISSTAGRGGRG